MPPRRQALALGAVLLAGSACSPSHLEQARRHQRQAVAAESRGDDAQRRAELEATIEQAEHSIADEEEGSVAPQAWLLVAWSQMALEKVGEAEKALAEVRVTGTRPGRTWQRHLLVATHCQLGDARGWGYWTGLCFDHLLEETEDAAPSMRDFAAVELANAHARGEPGYLDLTTYDAPLFRRFFALARAHPLDADLLSVLAARLAFHCGDHDFLRDVDSWRRVQVDLLTAAVALGTFSSADRRRSAANALGRAKAGRLCARGRP